MISFIFSLVFTYLFHDHLKIALTWYEQKYTLLKNSLISWVWWDTLLIWALRRQKLTDLWDFEASLVYKVSLRKAKARAFTEKFFPGGKRKNSLIIGGQRGSQDLVKNTRSDLFWQPPTEDNVFSSVGLNLTKEEGWLWFRGSFCTRHSHI